MIAVEAMHGCTESINERMKRSDFQGRECEPLCTLVEGIKGTQ